MRKAQVAKARDLPSSDLPIMDLSTIQSATDNFSDKNKLGEGGFGPVYRVSSKFLFLLFLPLCCVSVSNPLRKLLLQGMLEGGKEIAVKRLSAKSKQGTVEFRNEVELIAKLQHRNLVRMLGCCVDRDEKLLVYEYLPNRSLDAFLFGKIF